MITHTVFFRLHHEAGSPAEQLFLTAARALSSIPGLTDFRVLRQVNPTTGFDYGLTMDLADAAALEAYMQHPTHVDFVQSHWIPGVAAHLEIDYAPLD